MLAGTEKQCLTSYDTNNVMVDYSAMNKDSEVAFQDLMKTKMEVEKDNAAFEKRCYMMLLIEKKLMKSLKSSIICKNGTSSLH